LDDWLKRRYKIGREGDRSDVGVPGLGDCYVRGDNFGDRTQQLCIVNSKILTPELLKYLQEFLQSGWTDWRVMIAIGKPEEHVMIYPDVIRINPADEADLEGFCERMKPWFNKNFEDLLREADEEL